MGIFLIGIVFMLIGMWVSWRLKSKFKEYSQYTIMSGMSGREIAERMLKDHKIYDVQVMSVEGELTDHYNPANKTVNLSTEVYHGRHAAAAAVAAHECGHAVQHATAYSMLTFRSKMVPVVNVSSTILQYINMALMFGAGYLLYNKNAGGDVLILTLIALNAVVTLFALVTLPVEFDASARAMRWIENTRVASSQEVALSRDALKWAALTYVVAALGALANLAYYIMIFMGRRDDD
ncbi:MAG TPA: zinc metallopeptidase [Cytophagales bacterium]|nr:zinc metallopeptidase [Cytophagales bacterium]